MTRRVQRRLPINERSNHQPAGKPEDELARELAQVVLYSAKVGTIPREPGFINSLVYFFRLVMRRLLVWYTRPLHEYQSHVTHSLNIVQARLAAPALKMEEMMAGLRAVTANVDAAMRQVRHRQADLESDFQQQARFVQLRVTGLQNLLPASKAVAARRAGARNETARDLGQLPFGVNVVGHLRSEKGVGEALRASLRSLRAGNIPVCAREFLDPGSQNVETGRIEGSGNPYRFNLVHMNADQLSFFAAENRAFLTGRYNIGYWNWELASLPWDFYGKFRHLDEVWVPSSFTKASVAEISPIPVTCIPYSINPEAAGKPGETRARFGLPSHAFIFLFVFDFQSYEARKNPRGLLRAFQEAFGDQTDVLLLIKGSHGDFAPDQLQALQRLCQKPNVRLLDEVLPREALNSLLGACDCYVSLHRSEGFGLTMAEAMALGKPVIATGYSANMDFMNEDNSFLVRYRLVEIEDDYGPYTHGFLWAEPDLEHAAELMRRVRGAGQDVASIAARGRDDVSRKLHPATIARSMSSRLREISSYLGIP